MTKKLVITGDSWGCGEWLHQGNKFIISHKGLEQYFLDSGFDVTNFSVGGGSNLESFRSLETHINSVETKPDFVLFIKTDPIRDLKPYTNITHELIESKGVFNLNDKLSLKLYKNLDQLAKEKNIKIFLIGGYANLNLELLKDFSNLIPLVPSWVKRIVEWSNTNYYKIDDRFTSISEWGIRYINLSEIEKPLLEYIINELYDIHTWEMAYKLPLFYPDGRHPNRHAHKLLFEEIKDYFGLD